MSLHPRCMRLLRRCVQAPGAKPGQGSELCMEATPPLPSKPEENPDPRGLDFDVPDPRTWFLGVWGEASASSFMK